MKHCPRCRQTYTDETLKFCRVDGTLLQTSPVLPESSDTLILPGARTNVAEPTQLLQSETAQPEETPSSIEAPRNSQAGKLKAASENERLRRSVVIAVSVLILAATGFGFWLLKNRSSSVSSVPNVPMVGLANAPSMVRNMYRLAPAATSTRMKPSADATNQCP